MNKTYSHSKQFAVRIFVRCLMYFMFLARANAQGNIVQNGTFQSEFADWSGNIPAILTMWSSVPGGDCALANDIYQELPTIPGQMYSISFQAAADLYFGSSANIEVSLNSQALASFITPPYTYNSQINRYDQMHWEEYTSSFVASSSTTELEFIDMNTYDFGLTEVSVTSVPEPSTTQLLLLFLGATALLRYRSNQQPNKSPEPTAVGACRSAVAVRVARKAWISFLR